MMKLDKNKWNLNKWNLNSSEKKILLATALLLLMASSIVASSATNAPVRPEEEILGDDAIRSGVKVVLQVDILGPDGELKDTRLIEDDLITNNFVLIMSGIMSPSDSSSVLLTSHTNEPISFSVRSSSIVTSPTFHLLGSSGGGAGLKIAVGNGTNAPAASNYKLQSAVATYAIITNPVYSGGNITFSAAIAFSTAANITEAGFFYYNYPVSFYYMLCRDTFDAVEVAAEDSALVTYTVMLGDNFTDNFGKLLAGIFAPKLADERKDISLTDTSGASINVSVSGNNIAHHVFDSDVDRPKCGIAIGNSSSALGRSNYSLGSQVGVLAGTGTLIVNSSAVICSSLFTLGAADTVTEAGYFIKVKDTSGNTKSVMLWRDTFDGLAVSAGRSIAITFTFKVN